jgi:hypothetical protein
LAAGSFSFMIAGNFLADAERFKEHGRAKCRALRLMEITDHV